MDGVDLVLPGQGDDAGDVEVGADRLAGLADAVGLVGLEAVQGEAVFVRVDGDGADAQLVGGAEDADGDFAAIGDQQLADRRGAGAEFPPAWRPVPLGVRAVARRPGDG